MPPPEAMPWHARIYAPDGTQVVGAGVVIDRRRILTCAHVVGAALKLADLRTLPTGYVTVDFPDRPAELARPARVAPRGWLSQARPADDLAMLEVSGPDLPEASAAPLRPAGTLGRRMISVFGHPARYPDGVWADARLMGRGGPGAQWVQMDTPTRTGKRIQPGFSGAGVWAHDDEAVIGCVIAADRVADDRVAWMIPVEAIADHWPELHDMYAVPRLLRRPAPRPPRRTESPQPPAEQQRLARVMLALAGIRERPTRDIIVDAVERLFASRLQVLRADSDYEDILAIIDSCLEHPGALHELAEQIAVAHPAAAERHLIAAVVQAAEGLDPSPSLFPGERNRLYRLLDAADPHVRADMVSQSYEEALGASGTADINPLDLPSVMRKLEGTIGRDGLPPLIRFIEALCRELPGEIALGLRDWVDDFARRSGIPGEKILPLRLSISPPVPELTRGYLVTELTPDGAGPGYLIQIRLRHDVPPSQLPSGRLLHDGRDTPPLTIGQVPALFDAVLTKMLETTGDPVHELIVEFLLPFPLLSEPVDQWSIQQQVVPHPICIDYLVVVRSRDRMEGRSLRRSHPRWQERTRRLRNGDVQIYWVNPDDTAYVSGSLYADLAPTGRSCLALRRPPALGQELGNDAVSIGLWTGVPVMIWCRDANAAESFERRLSDYLANHSVADLPKFVQELREGADRPGGNDDQLSGNITLIWDLADQPTSYSMRLREPRPLGGSDYLEYTIWLLRATGGKYRLGPAAARDSSTQGRCGDRQGTVAGARLRPHPGRRHQHLHAHLAASRD